MLDQKALLSSLKIPAFETVYFGPHGKAMFLPLSLKFTADEILIYMQE